MAGAHARRVQSRVARHPGVRHRPFATTSSRPAGGQRQSPEMLGCQHLGARTRSQKVAGATTWRHGSLHRSDPRQPRRAPRRTARGDRGGARAPARRTAGSGPLVRGPDRRAPGAGGELGRAPLALAAPAAARRRDRRPPARTAARRAARARPHAAACRERRRRSQGRQGPRSRRWRRCSGRGRNCSRSRTRPEGSTRARSAFRTHCSARSASGSGSNSWACTRAGTRPRSAKWRRHSVADPPDGSSELIPRADPEGRIKGHARRLRCGERAFHTVAIGVNSAAHSIASVGRRPRHPT